jgi:hypothetical protein
MTWFRELDPEWQMLVVLASIIAAIGAIGWLVASVHAYRVYVTERADDDRSYRSQGHKPPESDPEMTTLMVPVITDDDLQCGTHSLRAVGLRTGGIRLVRTQDGLVQFLRTVADDTAYEGRHHLMEVGP